MSNDFLSELMQLDTQEVYSIEEDDNKNYIYDESVFKCSNIINSEQFIDLMNNLDNSSKITKLETLKIGRMENNSHNDTATNIYYLISKCHEYIATLNEDIYVLTKQIKDIYNKRFPELQNLVTSSYEYVLAVKNLGNTLELSNSNLQNIIANHTLMAINMISANTIGKPLNNYDLKLLGVKCDEVMKIHEYLNKMTLYIEGKMSIIAPNLTTLVGSEIAAKLIISANGIKDLAKMPAGNIQILGSKTVNLNGLSTTGKLHRGYLSDSAFVKAQPDSYKNQAIRKLSNKCALAARCDAFQTINNMPETNVKNHNLSSSNNLMTNNNIQSNVSNNSYGEDFFNDDQEINQNNNSQINTDNNSNSNANQGAKFKDLIENKLDKLKNYKQAVVVKPLPRPDDKPKKRRGGARIRRFKKSYELTEIRKQKNRVNFGTEGQIEDMASGEGYGMLGINGLNSKIKISKEHKKSQKINTKKTRFALNETTESHIDGLKSVINMSSNQGISLINPSIIQKNSKLTGADRTLFASDSGFTSIINQKKGDNNTNTQFLSKNNNKTKLNKKNFDEI